MALYQKRWEQHIAANMDEAWTFLSDPRNLALITPPEMAFKIIDSKRPGKMYPGMIIRYRVKVLPFFKVSWVTEISHVKEGSYFVDRQLSGPYSIWHHEHHIAPAEGGVLMTDILSYSPPLGILGRLANMLLIGNRITAIFNFRKEALESLFPVRE